MFHSHKYRVLLTDSVNGESFSFAVHYTAPSATLAERYANAEWEGLQVVEVRRV